MPVSQSKAIKPIGKKAKLAWLVLLLLVLAAVAERELRPSPTLSREDVLSSAESAFAWALKDGFFKDRHLQRSAFEQGSIQDGEVHVSYFRLIESPDQAVLVSIGKDGSPKVHGWGAFPPGLVKRQGD